MLPNKLSTSLPVMQQGRKLAGHIACKVKQETTDFQFL